MNAYSFLISLILCCSVWAQEQDLNLDDLKSEPAPAQKIKAHDFKLMGRLDLTWEYGNPNPSASPDGKSRNTLENNHQFIFLKIKASEKSTIMAEVVNKSFFYAEYSGSLADVQLGNILVPFGDNRRYHLFYGGIQGYGAEGVMFANVWSEPGFNISWKTRLGSLDTYIVDSISAPGATSDPNFKTDANTSHQAGGLRLTSEIASGWTSVISGYTGEYWPGKGLHIFGFDIYSDYGTSLLGKNFRFAFGVAQATVLQSPTLNGENFEKTGDFVELATHLIGPGEARLRYGTYINNSEAESNQDVHNWNFGYLFQLDAFHVLMEHQVNMEEVNEIKNDITRVMVSVNF